MLTARWFLRRQQQQQRGGRPLLGGGAMPSAVGIVKEVRRGASDSFTHPSNDAKDGTASTNERTASPSTSSSSSQTAGTPSKSDFELQLAVYMMRATAAHQQRMQPLFPRINRIRRRVLQRQDEVEQYGSATTTPPTAATVDAMNREQSLRHTSMFSPAMWSVAASVWLPPSHELRAILYFDGNMKSESHEWSRTRKESVASMLYFGWDCAWQMLVQSFFIEGVMKGFVLSASPSAWWGNRGHRSTTSSSSSAEATTTGSSASGPSAELTAPTLMLKEIIQAKIEGYVAWKTTVQACLKWNDQEVIWKYGNDSEQHRDVLLALAAMEGLGGRWYSQRIFLESALRVEELLLVKEQERQKKEQQELRLQQLLGKVATQTKSTTTTTTTTIPEDMLDDHGGIAPSEAYLHAEQTRSLLLALEHKLALRYRHVQTGIICFLFGTLGLLSWYYVRKRARRRKEIKERGAVGLVRPQAGGKDAYTGW